MLKKLFTLAAILLLVSCHGKTKTASTEVDNDFKIDDKTNAGTGTYQTLDNEQQAIELNQQSDQAQEVEVQDRVLFNYDSAALDDESKKILDTQVSWLKSDSVIKVTIEGHCDERGTREYNLALGEKRADAVKDYLISHGIDASRIKVTSFGKERPAFFGATDAIFAKNRRAVTVIN